MSEHMFGGGLKGMMFRQHLPLPSDPPIPPKNECLLCGKTGLCGEKEHEEESNSSSHKLKRCGRCKMALFCNAECQAAAWKGKNGPKHKNVCKQLVARNQPNMLPYQVRVIRHKHGAYIHNGQDIPKAKTFKQMKHKRFVQFLMGNHSRLGQNSPVLPLKVAQLKQVWSFIQGGRDLQEEQVIPSHPCARDRYYEVVQHLTEEQKEQRYPMACIERWSNFENNHYDRDAENEERHSMVPLSAFLASPNGIYEGCTNCVADGSSFFSFCLNRPVNDNMVEHCEWCHKCFYYQPGELRGCEHCGMGRFSLYPDDGGDEEELISRLADAAGISMDEATKMVENAEPYSDIEIKYTKEWRGTNVPEKATYFARGLASEGFWGW